MLRYRIEGSGPPLLLIHGWGVTYTIWQNLMPLLKSHFQLIMIELPGVGGSPQADLTRPYYLVCAEAIEEVRQTLGIEQWSILAYSSGTRAGEAYVQRYPQHTSRAIFLCPIYLTEVFSRLVRLLDDVNPPQIFTNWLLSKWRLYSLILALGFNGRPHDYTSTWKREIELQSVDTLIRSLCELPGKGRAPFELPAVPTLFIWGSRDALVARPRRPRSNDVVIPADHSAPMLAARTVAEVVTPFVKEGKISHAPATRSNWKRLYYGQGKGFTAAREHARLLSLIRRAALLRRTGGSKRSLFSREHVEAKRKQS